MYSIGYTYYDWFEVGAGNNLERCHQQLLVRNWSVFTFTNPELDHCQGKWLFCLIYSLVQLLIE